MINLKKVLLLYSKKFLDGEISSFPTTDYHFLSCNIFYLNSYFLGNGSPTHPPLLYMDFF